MGKVFCEGRRAFFAVFVVAALVPCAYAGQIECEAALTEALFPITQEEVVYGISQVLQNHATQDSLTLELTEFAAKNLAEVIDPGKQFLLQSDIAALENPSIELSQQLQGFYSGSSSKKIQALTELRIKALQALQETYDFLVKTPGLRQKVTKLAAEAPQERSTEGDIVSFPRTAGERQQRLIDFLVASIRFAKNSDLTETDGYLKGMRQMMRFLAERKAFIEGAGSLKNGGVVADDTEPAMLFQAFTKSLDPHSIYHLPSEWRLVQEHGRSENYAGLGIHPMEVSNGLKIMKVEVGAAGEKAGILVGDIITAVNGEKIRARSALDAGELIRGAEGTKVKLEIVRNGATLVLEATRAIVQAARQRVLPKILETQFGPAAIVDFGSFFTGAAKEVYEQLAELSNTKQIVGVILDLRGNGGGNAEEATLLLSMFINEGPLFVLNNRTDPRLFQSHPQVPKFNGPLVVLVDEYSASASELVAGTLQDYGRAIIVGTTQSFGKGTNQALIPTPDAGGMRITHGTFHTASGETPQHVGVRSDIVLAELQSNAHLEKNMPGNAVPPVAIPSLMPGKYPYMPGREEVIPFLAKRSLARRAANPAWAEIKDSIGLLQHRDLAEQEAAKVLEDMLLIIQQQYQNQQAR